MMRTFNECFFYKNDDGEYKSLGNIEDIPTLSSEDLETEDEWVRNFVNGTEMSFECQIELENGKNLGRFLRAGCDRGRYNGLTLKEEGYLNPENGWVDDD